MIIINIGSPAPGQTVASGKLVVSGIAVETGSNPAEPRSIVNVSVNSVDAVLGSPPLPERGAVGFSASVEAGSGEFQITVTATDDIGLKASKSVMINVTGGVVLPIWPGTPWTNYVQTQAITPEFFCGPRSIDDLVAIVRLAEARGKKVHAQGSTYSFSDCAMTTDYMVDTRALRKPVQYQRHAVAPKSRSKHRLKQHHLRRCNVRCMPCVPRLHGNCLRSGVARSVEVRPGPDDRSVNVERLCEYR